MAKQTFYFPHDGNARNDDRIIAVRMRHKMEGYGVYFAILERLLESSNYRCAKDYNVIAFDLHVAADLVKSIVENFGLFKFTEDGEFFYSDSFSNRMKPLENIREQRRLAGKKSAEKRAKTNESSATVQRPLPKNATEESKREESKVKNSSNSSTHVPLGDNENSNPEKIDYNKLVAWFNETTKGVFASVKSLTDVRKKRIKAIVQEYGKENFANVVYLCLKSDFLKGTGGRWCANFDWIINKNNFVKILEGNYENKRSTGGNTTDQDLARSIAEGAARADNPHNIWTQ